MAEPVKHYRSLDGLRGIAALVVVIYHSMIATPRFGQIRLRPGEQDVSYFEFAISYTPLRLFWSGTEAVVVFFVLSGFVLSLPFARSGGYPGRYFYPRRMLRLYLPAIASLVFAFTTALLVPRGAIADASPWVIEHAERPNGLLQVLLGSSLIHGWGGLNLSLWSLRWEVIFSLMLAVFLWFARIVPKLLWVKIALVVAICAFWPLANIFYPDGVFIAVFALGVLMAFNIPKLDRIANRLPTRTWGLVFLLAATLLTYSGIVIGARTTTHMPELMSVWISFASMGAVLLVFAALKWQPLVRVLGSPSIQWLGKVSFSLYLIQDPVVVTIAELTGGTAPRLAVIPVSIAACLVVAYGFYRVVERPSHLLSRSFLRKRELNSKQPRQWPTDALDVPNTSR